MKYEEYKPYRYDAYESELRLKLEGRLLVHEWFGKMMKPGEYHYTRTFYTVIEGVVYHISSQGMNESGDTLSDILNNCQDIGVYDENNPPEFVFRSFKASEFRKKFGIPPVFKRKPIKDNGTGVL